MRKVWISLCVLIIVMGSAMAENNNNNKFNRSKKEEELEELSKKWKIKGKTTSEYRSKEHNEAVYKKIGKPVNKTSYHQLQGGGYDLVGLTDKERKEFVKDHLDRGMFAYENKDTKQVHADIGPIKKEDRIRVFKELKKDTDTKGAYYYGTPNKENNRTPQSIEEPMIDDELENEDDKLKKIAKTNPTMAAYKIGKDSPTYNSMATSQKDKSAEQAMNVDTMTSSAAQSEEDKLQGKQSSVKNDFLQAITYFLPSIAGLAIGGAIGGEEGAAKGAELGMKAGESYAGYKLQQQKIRQTGLNRKMQQTNFTDKEGNPITYDPTSNKFVKASGEVAEEGDFDDPISARQAKNLELRRESLRLADVKLKHNIAKDAQLSDTQVKRFEDMSSVLEGIDRVDVLKKDVATGIGIKQFRNLQEFANQAPAKYTEMKSETAALLANYVKAISGAQVSEQEAQRLGTIIPTAGDAPLVFETKLRTFRRIVKTNERSFKKAILSGQPLKAGTIRGLDEAVKEIEKQESEKDDKRKRLEALRAKKARSNK